MRLMENVSLLGRRQFKVHFFLHDIDFVKLYQVAAINNKIKSKTKMLLLPKKLD